MEETDLSLETQSQARLDFHEEQIKDIRIALKKIKQSFEEEKLKEEEFQTFMINWTKQQQKLFVEDGNNSFGHTKSPGELQMEELPIFSGKDPRAWLRKIESYFMVHQTPSVSRFSLIKKCMKHRAEYWFSIHTDCNPHLTWSQFKEDFMERFAGLESRGEESTTSTHSKSSSNGSLSSPINGAAADHSFLEKQSIEREEAEIPAKSTNIIGKDSCAAAIQIEIDISDYQLPQHPWIEGKRIDFQDQGAEVLQNSISFYPGSGSIDNVSPNHLKTSYYDTGQNFNSKESMGNFLVNGKETSFLGGVQKKLFVERMGLTKAHVKSLELYKIPKMAWVEGHYLINNWIWGGGTFISQWNQNLIIYEARKVGPCSLILIERFDFVLFICVWLIGGKQDLIAAISSIWSPYSRIICVNILSDNQLTLEISSSKDGKDSSNPGFDDTGQDLKVEWSNGFQSKFGDSVSTVAVNFCNEDVMGIKDKNIVFQDEGDGDLQDSVWNYLGWGTALTACKLEQEVEEGSHMNHVDFNDMGLLIVKGSNMGQAHNRSDLSIKIISRNKHLQNFNAQDIFIDIFWVTWQAATEEDKSKLQFVCAKDFVYAKCTWKYESVVEIHYEFFAVKKAEPVNCNSCNLELQDSFPWMIPWMKKNLRVPTGQLNFHTPTVT